MREIFIFLQFQFHKGTIKTAVRATFESVKYVFQFHKGTIKTYSK